MFARARASLSSKLLTSTGWFTSGGIKALAKRELHRESKTHTHTHTHTHTSPRLRGLPAPLRSGLSRGNPLFPETQKSSEVKLQGWRDAEGRVGGERERGRASIMADKAESASSAILSSL